MDARHRVGHLVRIGVDVEPERNLGQAPRVVGAVEDAPLGRPLRRQRPGAVLPRGRPPVALERGDGDLVARTFRGLAGDARVLDGRDVGEIVLGGQPLRLDARLGIVRRDVEPRAVLEERNHHRHVAAAAGHRPAAAPGTVPHQSRAGVGTRLEDVRLATLRNVAEVRVLRLREAEDRARVLHLERPPGRAVDREADRRAHRHGALLARQVESAPDKGRPAIRVPFDGFHAARREVRETGARLRVTGRTLVPERKLPEARALGRAVHEARSARQAVFDALDGVAALRLREDEPQRRILQRQRERRAGQAQEGTENDGLHGEPQIVTASGSPLFHQQSSGRTSRAAVPAGRRSSATLNAVGADARL